MLDELSVFVFTHTLHGTKSTHLEHQPRELLDVLGAAGRIANLSVGVVLVGQVEHDGATFEDAL